MVWRPRNGEKPMKTPIEEASAARSGGSSIASRRRNVGRNIGYYRSPIVDCRFLFTRVLNRQSAMKSLKTLQSFRFIIVRVENCQQFRNHQQVLDSIRQLQQLELPALTLHGRVAGNQLADASRVDVFDSREIEQDFRLAFVSQISDGVAQGNTAVTDSHFTTQIENGDVSRLSFTNIELGHRCLRFYLKLLRASASLS